VPPLALNPTETLDAPLFAPTATPLITPTPDLHSPLPQAPSPTFTPLLHTPTATTPPPLRFAVIGDYGQAGPNLAAVAEMILGWQPDLILTVGDNNYPNGAAGTIDENIGQYFHTYIYPYQGAYGEGAETNRFYPALGNHDWNSRRAQPYLDYFTLPGNERYYDLVQYPVHFFILDTDTREPDGVGRSRAQAAWLQAGLAASTASWQVVLTHFPPYSSAYHGSTNYMWWPFADWGADAVLAGHDHVYERLEVDGMLYLVNGLGGGVIYDFYRLHPGSLFRYNEGYGAMLVTATPQQITFEFYAVPGELIDSYTLTQP
jgi:tartrate-resistant acid phosphatase type 5